MLDYLDFFLQQLILLAGVPVPADVQAVWLVKNEHKGSDSSRKNTRQRHKKKYLRAYCFLLFVYLGGDVRCVV